MDACLYTCTHIYMQECIAKHYLCVSKEVNGYIQTQPVVVQTVSNIMHALVGGLSLVKMLLNKLIKFSEHREVHHSPQAAHSVSGFHQQWPHMGEGPFQRSY